MSQVSATAEAIVDGYEKLFTKLDEMSAPKLYPLDKTEFEVEITAGKHVVSHRLTKPTLEQLMDRESRSHYETEAVSNDEERVNADDEQANARLWDAIAKEVRGYRLNKADSAPLSNWRPITDELRAAIPASHKAAAVRGLYQFVCEVDKDDDEGFTLAAENWTIKQSFGDADFPDYVVRHILRTPTETERREFKRKSSDVRFSKGARKLKTKVITHLKAHVEFYDLLLTRLDGVSMDGATWETFTAKTKADMGLMVRTVDSIWKRSVIDCLMKEFEAGLSD